VSGTTVEKDEARAAKKDERVRKTGQQYLQGFFEKNIDRCCLACESAFFVMFDALGNVHIENIS